MKNYFARVKTIRGNERIISCGSAPKILLYPDKYEEDFEEFPIEIILTVSKKGPVLNIVKGKCKIKNWTE